MENLVAEIRIHVDEKHLEFFVTGNEGPEFGVAFPTIQRNDQTMISENDFKFMVQFLAEREHDLMKCEDNDVRQKRILECLTSMNVAICSEKE